MSPFGLAVTTIDGGVVSAAFEPPPPPNGGNTRDYLQRIEAKADHAAEVADRAEAASLRLERWLRGDYGSPGQITLLNKKMDDFITATELREKSHDEGSRFRISNRLASITVIIMAIVGLGSIVVALVK